jgi:ubiquinone biosynthesis protein COQ9
MTKIENQREEFIKAAIPFICKDGWGESTLKEASNKLFKDELYYKTLFDSTSSIVQYFQDLEDTRILKKIGKKNQKESIRLHIGKMVLCRIKELSGGMEMRKALQAHYKNIRHLDEGAKALWRTADIIWRAAGDTSTDMNHYSKRFLLSGIMLASYKHYIKSPDDIDEYVTDSLDKLVKRMQKLKIPKLEDIPIFRMFT